MATAMYAEDYNDRLPPASHWSDVVEPRVLKAPPGLEGRVEHPFDCPSSESKASYGINAALDRLALEKVDQPAASVLLFEADAPFRSYAGGRQDVAAERHNLGSHYAFVDGHVKYYSPQAAMNLNWNAKSIAEGTTAK
jgi:prepilin-type processing-associated H-X9-DG protein